MGFFFVGGGGGGGGSGASGLKGIKKSEYLNVPFYDPRSAACDEDR